MIYSQTKLERERAETIREINKKREEATKEVNERFEIERNKLLNVAKEKNIYDWTIIKLNMSKLAFGSTFRGQIQAQKTAEIEEWLEENCNDEVFMFLYENDQNYLCDDECADDDDDDYHGGRRILFYFKDAADATVFKMTWC